MSNTVKSGGSDLQVSVHSINSIDSEKRRQQLYDEQRRRLEKSDKDKDIYAPYPETFVYRNPPPGQLSTQMYNRNGEQQGGRDGGSDPYSRGAGPNDSRDRAVGPSRVAAGGPVRDNRVDPRDARDRGDPTGPPPDRGQPSAVGRRSPRRSYSNEDAPRENPGNSAPPISRSYDQGDYYGRAPGPGPGPGDRGPPPVAGSRGPPPPGDYPERYRSQQPQPPQEYGRAMPQQLSGRGSPPLASETLAMYEQDFLDRHVYSNNPNINDGPEDNDPTHHTRGRSGPPRPRSPTQQQPHRELYPRVHPNQNNDNNRGYPPDDRGYPPHPNARGGPPPEPNNYYDDGVSYGERGPPPPNNYYDDVVSYGDRGPPPPNNYYDDGPPRYENDRGPPRDRGMDDSAPGRPQLQRIPSQSTISTSGFRSFYSDAFTYREQGSLRSDNRHQYDRPPPPPPRDDYGQNSPDGTSVSGRSFGGSTWDTRGGSTWDTRGGSTWDTRGSTWDTGTYDTRGSVGSRSAGVGFGYDDDPPPLRRPPPPPPRDYGGPPPRRPAPATFRGTPDRPLLEVAPGLLMHLMGTEETMKAIQDGQITVTSCVVCGMDVHCHSASEYVLCPDCRVVSPVNQLDNAADMTPQQGGLVGLGVKTEMLITMMEAAGASGQY